MSEMMIISADSHASEPKELFERLPEEYRKHTPNGGAGRMHLLHPGWPETRKIVGEKAAELYGFTES